MEDMTGIYGNMRTGMDCRDSKGGDTLLQAGDNAIVVTKAFEDTQTYLVEKTVKTGGKRAGHAISEFSNDVLVILKDN